MTSLSNVLNRKELSVRMEIVAPDCAAFFYPADKTVSPEEEQERREHLAICLADCDGITGVELAKGRIIVSIHECRQWHAMKYEVGHHFRFVYSGEAPGTGSKILDRMVSACFSGKLKRAKTRFMEENAIVRSEVYNLADKRMNIVFRRVETVSVRTQGPCKI